MFLSFSKLVSSDKNPLSYRQISDLLVELENSGLVVPRAYSKGRNGYGKEYKLTISPDLVGPSVDKEYYDSLVKGKVLLVKIKNFKKQ